MELEVTVIAESIECGRKRYFLADCGIVLMQEFWFAKPAFKALAPVDSRAWQIA
jgi:EAL domain-containing protein (putative c-di-GMP-specific phosphodiesterase class I)